ncbi:MAG: hypothetical protein KA771_09195 [Spirochaetales bacterium]|nr:hypothetical protein [Spirochaetales bacterium]
MGTLKNLSSKPVYPSQHLVQLFLDGREVVFRVPNSVSRSRELLEKHLFPLLQAAGFDRYSCELFFCLHELVANGQKANLKRIFFNEKGLNIDTIEDYATGMKLFHSYVSQCSAEEQRKKLTSSYWVKVGVKKLEHALRIRVMNNSTLHCYERLRILEKESLSRRITSLAELLLDSHDEEEGTGLGLLFLFFILKNALKGSTFSLHTEPGLTSIELLFPLYLIPENRS